MDSFIVSFCETRKMLSRFFKIFVFNRGNFCINATLRLLRSTLLLNAAFILLSSLEEIPHIHIYVIAYLIVAWKNNCERSVNYCETSLGCNQQYVILTWLVPSAVVDFLSDSSLQFSAFQTPLNLIERKNRPKFETHPTFPWHNTNGQYYMFDKPLLHLSWSSLPS